MVGILLESDISDLRRGETVLLLGAGASLGNTRYDAHDNRPILGAEALSKKICGWIGEPYEDENLREVYDAAIVKRGKPMVRDFLMSEYTGLRPSKELTKLFDYCWYRVYTLNIDDSVYNIPKKNTSQKLEMINGIGGDRTEWRGHGVCQVIHLHGAVWDPDPGFVFSDEEYGAVYDRRLGWYQQLREDFRNRTLLIVGSRLDEQFILSMIKKEEWALQDTRRSKLIIPSVLSNIRVSSLTRAKIDYVKGDLAELSVEIERALGSRVAVSDILSKEIGIEERLLSKFSRDDVRALEGLFHLDKQFFARSVGISDTEKRNSRRQFFEGYGPNWHVVAEDTFFNLSQFGNLDSLVSESILTGNRLNIVKGEAGSGKSTFVYIYAKNHYAEYNVFEYRKSSAPFGVAMAALSRLLGETERALVIFDDFHIIYDEVQEYFDQGPSKNIYLLTSVRSTDWNGQVSKQVGGRKTLVTLNRFGEQDYDEMISKVSAFYIAPNFNKLSYQEKLSVLKKSRRQILFAMRAASESDVIDSIVHDEYMRSLTPSLRHLLAVICLATLSRVGISKSALGSIWELILDAAAPVGSTSDSMRLGDGLSRLEGTIDIAPNGRYKARHDLYAGIILEKISDINEIILSYKLIVSHYGEYKWPIISNISRIDGQLFKYVLNNRSNYDFFKKKNSIKEAESLYGEFEQPLQLDGHYWLQFGLYLRRCGKHLEALSRFEKSIEAYPNNPYSEHALAQQKLINAAIFAKEKPATAQRWISEAEEALVQRHYESLVDTRRRSFDEYPLSVLGRYHIDALISMGNQKEAIEKARKYFNMIKDIERSNIRDSQFDDVKGRLLNFVVNGIWKSIDYKMGKIEYF